MILPSKSGIMEPRSSAKIEQHNFMELPNGEVQSLSQAAISKALAEKQLMGLPMTIWNNGNPYRQYPDGRIEYIQLDLTSKAK
jgi:hypothetical protein